METNQEFTIREIELEKAFKIHEDFDIEKDFKYPYHLTPYQGCTFQCVYCFNNRNPKYWTKVDKKDSEIVVAKNIVDLVQGELGLITPNSQLPLICRIGTEAEIYGPAEEHYKLTRRILEAFTRYPEWHLRIPTKSDLVLRDIDLLQELDALVTMTLVTTIPAYAEKLEPNAPSVRARLQTLKQLRDAGIKCRIRCEPYIEGISDVENMEKVKEWLGLEEVKVKPLNYFTQEEIMKFLE